MAGKTNPILLSFVKSLAGKTGAEKRQAVRGNASLQVKEIDDHLEKLRDLVQLCPDSEP